jgi:hypothetical protein
MRDVMREAIANGTLMATCVLGRVEWRRRTELPGDIFRQAGRFWVV